MDKNSVNHFHRQLLTHIKEGRNEDAQGILKNLKTTDVIDSSGKSLLHWGVELGNKKIIQHFIDNGYNIDTQDNDGNTPLMLAVEAEKEYLIEMLLTAGANIHLCNTKGMSPVKLVLSEWILPGKEVVKLFLDRLRDECGTDKRSLVRKLIDFKCPVYFAVLLRDAEITRMMLDRGCSVEARCYKVHDTALHEAVAQSDLANVKLLVDRGARVNDLGYQKEPPLYRYNVWTKDTHEKLEMLKFLIAKGSTLYHPKRTPPLKRLFKEGNKETVCTLLQIEGIDLRAKYKKNRTALHFICENENPGMADAIRLFRGKYFDIDATDENGMTALMIAGNNRRARIVECLLEMGADVKICNEYRHSALYEACCNGCKWSQQPRENFQKIVDVLLQYGVDILQNRSNCDDTVLEHSIMRKNFHLAKSVLARLAQMEILGEFGILNNCRDDIKWNEKHEEYYVSCLKQLGEMKTSRVYGSITLLDLLNGSREKLYSAVRNHDFILEFNRIMVEKNDTIPHYYSSAIHRRVATAVATASLEEQAAAVICKIIGLADKHIVAYEIVDYLEARDRMNLIETIQTNE